MKPQPEDELGRESEIKRLYLAARQLPMEERRAFLDEACAVNEALRREVEALLQYDQTGDGFLARPAAELFAAELAGGQRNNLIGTRLGEYQIEAEIGRGGMGEIYKAKHTKLGREAAIKILPAEFTVEPERVRRFEQEARAASSLNHPNIVTVYEIGRHEEIYYIACELVDGVTLRQRMAKSRLTMKETLDIAAQVATALKTAHNAEIFHRDIKPENLMLRDKDGLVKVLDFGIAKLGGAFVVPPSGGCGSFTSLAGRLKPPLPPEGGTTNLTAAGAILGTANYMSPEQACREEVDGRSDLFSLGAVMYEMAMGERLFPGATPAEVIEQLRRPQEPLHSAVKFSGAAKHLELIIRKCLRRKREERYQSAAELLGELQRLKRQLEMQAIRRVVAIVSLVAALAMMAIGLVIPASIHEEWVETRMRDGHTGHVRRAVFSPDGRWLVSVGEDKQVIVWDFARRSKRKVMHDHADLVTALAYSPDGRWFATGSHDQTVIVWDGQSFEKITTLRDHHDPVRALAFSPDGQSLVSISSIESDNTGQTIVWRAGEWRKVWEFAAGQVFGNMHFSPDSRLLMTPMGRWDLVTGKELPQDESIEWGNWSEFSPDKRMMVAAYTAPFFFLLDRPGDIDKRKLIHRERVHQDYGRAVAFSPDGKLVATGADDIVVWEAATQKIWARWDFEAIVWSLTFSPDGKWLVSAHSDGSILLWGIARMERAASLNGHSKGVRGVAISPDQTRIASAGEDRSVIIWNVASREKEVVLQEHDARVTSAVFSPDGKWMASADQEEFLIRWDLERQQPVWKIRFPNIAGIVSLAVSPDGKWLATSRSVHRSDDGSGVVNFDSLNVGDEGIAFSADGRRLACVGPRRIHVFDTGNWQISAQRSLPNVSFISVAFLPDGRKLVTSDLAGQVKLWDASTLEPIAPLGKHNARIKSLVALPDGDTVVSCGDDKKIRMWSIRQGKEIRTIGEHSSPVLALAASRDGNLIVSGEHDKSVRLYTRKHSLWGWPLDESNWLLKFLR